MKFLEFISKLEAPILVLMGFVIIYLVSEIIYWKKVVKEKNKLVDKKDEQLMTLSEKIIKVASLWDTKSDLNTREHDELTKLARETRDDVKQIKGKM